MLYTIIIAILAFVLYLVFKFRSDMNAKNTELAEEGGIKNKYKELIKSFDNYDVDKRPSILTDKVNNYEIGWLGQTTNTKLWLNEVHNSLYVRFTLKYNKRVLREMGININELPNLNEQLEWKFDSRMNQTEMQEIIMQDINTVMKKYDSV